MTAAAPRETAAAPRRRWHHALSERGIAPGFFIIALVIIVLFTAMALLAPWVMTADPFANLYAADGRLARYHLPSADYLFGTNTYGQDIFVQTILGARRTLIIGAVSGVAIMAIGTLVGVVSGYFGGWVDSVLMRITDFFYAIPFLPFALVYIHFFGTDLVTVCTAMALIFWRTAARVVRAMVLSMRERQYVKAAQAMGHGSIWIMTFHILPSVLGVALLYGIFGAAWAVLTEATLSFIGLVDPASVSWGLMLNQAFASGAIRFAWWWVIPPGISLSLFLAALFLMARSIEGAVDKRLIER